MEKLNLGTPVVRSMDGWQPKPLLLQQLSSVQHGHGSSEHNGNDAAKHGPECPTPLFVTWHHCDPSTTRPFGPLTERSIGKPYKHNTDTSSSLIDVLWIPSGTRTVSTLSALSDVDRNVRLVSLSFYPRLCIERTRNFE